MQGALTKGTLAQEGPGDKCATRDRTISVYKTLGKRSQHTPPDSTIYFHYIVQIGHMQLQEYNEKKRYISNSVDNMSEYVRNIPAKGSVI